MSSWWHRVVASTAALLVLTACSGSNSGQPEALPSRRPSPSATSTTAGTVVRVTGTVATGLASPWGLAFLPDGRALVSERDTGRLLLLDGRGGATTVGTVPGVVHVGEGGLLGIAVSPSFATDGYVYAYETTQVDNRVVRLQWTPAGLGAPTVIVAGIPSADHHNGGGIIFGPDRMLYIGTGDAGTKVLSQDVSNLGGKILRVTPDGRPAPGNPFPTSPVWSYGHRNVEGLAFDAAGRLWADEFGQNRWDELNLITKGANYGWPIVEGIGHRPGYVDPLREWPTDQASPSGIAIADGYVWLAALHGARLWSVPLHGTTTGQPVAYLSGRYGRLRTVAVAPDGSLWLMTNNTDGRGKPRPGDDRILRLAIPRP